MPPDPIATLEEAHSQRSLGAFAVNVYHGARLETDARTEALWATVAAILAMLASTTDDEPPPEEPT